jgi:hypothetical protein
MEFGMREPCGQRRPRVRTPGWSRCWRHVHVDQLRVADGGEQQESADEIGRPAQSGWSSGLRRDMGYGTTYAWWAAWTCRCPRTMSAGTCVVLVTTSQVVNFQLRAANLLLAMSLMPLVSFTWY